MLIKIKSFEISIFLPFASKCLQYVVDDGASYSPYVRPVIDNTKPLDLEFGISVSSIDGMQSYALNFVVY